MEISSKAFAKLSETSKTDINTYSISAEAKAVSTPLGYMVIAERYLPDFLVWVSLTTRDANYLGSLEAKFMLALSMKADVKAYVTASEAELVKRRSGEDGREFLSRQLKLYDKVVKLVKAYKIDTTRRSIKETLNELLSIAQPLATVT